MTISYEIDVVRGVVFTIASGVLTDDDLLAHKQKLARDPDFKPGMVELSDVRSIERLDVTPDGIARMVTIDGSDSDLLGDFKLAIVASEDVVFGMARMYQIRTDDNPLRVNIFRDMNEARAWLGLS